MTIIIIIIVIATIIALDTDANTTTDVNTTDVNANTIDTVNTIDGLGDGDVVDDIFAYSVAGPFNLATATREDILRRVRPSGEVQTWEFSYNWDFVNEDVQDYELQDEAWDLAEESGDLTKVDDFYEALIAKNEEVQLTCLQESLQQIEEDTDTDKVICASLRGEEFGDYGVYVRGEVILAADEDLCSAIVSFSKGTLTCNWKEKWSHILLDENANRMVPKESGHHEIWMTRFKVTSAWVKNYASERQKKIVYDFSMERGIPFSEI